MSDSPLALGVRSRHSLSVTDENRQVSRAGELRTVRLGQLDASRHRAIIASVECDVRHNPEGAHDREGEANGDSRGRVRPIHRCDLTLPNGLFAERNYGDFEIESSDAVLKGELRERPDDFILNVSAPRDDWFASVAEEKVELLGQHEKIAAFIVTLSAVAAAAAAAVAAVAVAVVAVATVAAALLLGATLSTSLAARGRHLVPAI